MKKSEAVDANGNPIVPMKRKYNKSGALRKPYQSRKLKLAAAAAAAAATACLSATLAASELETSGTVLSESGLLSGLLAVAAPATAPGPGKVGCGDARRFGPSCMLQNV